MKGANAIFLDEATAMLDSITEREINKSLIEITKDRTCVIVAHRQRRLSTNLMLEPVFERFLKKTVNCNTCR